MKFLSMAQLALGLLTTVAMATPTPDDNVAEILARESSKIQKRCYLGEGDAVCARCIALYGAQCGVIPGNANCASLAGKSVENEKKRKEKMMIMSADNSSQNPLARKVAAVK
ncbi:hypothetical protein HJFPF1_13060 [Paramyrothecium foliicola]|nr:hypothetical protein HJFPF1_13060 [Paramyrothecium foliicola]